MLKKLLLVSLLLAIVTPVSAFEEIECSTDTVFSENSCNQCFDGGNKSTGDNIGLLSDDWLNVTSSDKILYKEEQSMPKMMNLGDTNTTWSQSPENNEEFWEYTTDFDGFYSDDQEGYVLPAGKSVTWIKSKLSSTYTLDANTAPVGSNIGLLVYPIAVHDIDDKGDIALDAEEHRECVLFKSNSPADPVVPQEPTRLPETGPAEYLLLLLMAMILGFGVLKISRKA